MEGGGGSGGLGDRQQQQGPGRGPPLRRTVSGGDLSPGGDGSGQLQAGLLHTHAHHHLTLSPQPQLPRHLSSPPLPHHIQHQQQQQQQQQLSMQQQQHLALSSSRHHHPLMHHLGGGMPHSLQESSMSVGVHHSEPDHLDDPLTSSGPVQLHDGLTDSHQASLLHRPHSADAPHLIYSMPPGLGGSGGFGTMTQAYGHHYHQQHHQPPPPRQHHTQHRSPHQQHQLHHQHQQFPPPPAIDDEDEEEPDTPVTTTTHSARGVEEAGGEEAGEGEESIGKDGTRFVSLREREEIARWAYRTWFSVKPGHKEVKDKWWALYYRKLLPQYHLRDNYLGRKINQWIEEDLEPLKVAHPEQFAQKAQGRPGRKPKIRTNPDGTPMKRRKPNSSKEGTMPAYANVEMIQPTANEGMDTPFMQKLATCCVDNNVDWSAEQLEADMAWFKKNRLQIMENIPSLTKGSKRKKEQGGATLKRHRPTDDPPKHVHSFPDGVELSCDIPWIKTDMHKTVEAYVIQIDLPGVAPETDLSVKTDGNKLVIKGERKNRHSLLSPESESTLENLLVQRPEGPFSLQVVLPPNADIAHTEQRYRHGVLTIKVPLQAPQWRTLDILHLSPNRSHLD